MLRWATATTAYSFLEREEEVEKKGRAKTQVKPCLPGPAVKYGFRPSDKRVVNKVQFVREKESSIVLFISGYVTPALWRLTMSLFDFLNFHS